MNVSVSDVRKVSRLLSGIFPSISHFQNYTLRHLWITWVNHLYLNYFLYSCAPISADSVSMVSVTHGLLWSEKENWKIKDINGFKMCAKWEWAVTWWNPVAQIHPVLGSSSFVPMPTLPHRTCLQSASSDLAVHISCHVITLFVFRKPLFIN
jgi:hypothetical protein